MGFKDWIIDLFEDERGATSIKPLIAFICTLVLCGTLLVNAFMHREFEPSDNLVDAILMIGAIGLSGDTVDKFTFRNRKSKKHLEEQPEPPLIEENN